jgi:phenylalanyl-tRNA synthetase beta chain
MILSLASINGLLGASLNPLGASRLAEKAGYRVKQASGKSIHIEIPSYRIDIMHPVDVMEDIAIASDLNTLQPEWPNIWTIGGLAKQTADAEILAEIMIGLGFQEVLTYVLTSTEIIGSKMGISPDRTITLANPKMTTHMVMRNSLMPSLLEFLSHNTHVDYPQRIFEIGSAINRGDASSMPIREDRKIAAITIHSEAGFTEIRSSLDALIRSVGHNFEVQPVESPIFLTGRCGTVISSGRNVGIVGEINPRILQAFGLNLPAAGFELDMPKQVGNEILMETRSG